MRQELHHKFAGTGFIGEVLSMMPLKIENTLKNYKVSILGKNLPDQGSFTSPLYNKGWRYDLGGRLSKLAPRLEGSQPWRHNQDD